MLLPILIPFEDTVLYPLKAFETGSYFYINDQRSDATVQRLLARLSSSFFNREFEIPRRRRPRKRGLKSEFAFFQSLSRLL